MVRDDEDWWIQYDDQIEIEISLSYPLLKVLSSRASPLSCPTKENWLYAKEAPQKARIPALLKGCTKSC